MPDDGRGRSYPGLLEGIYPGLDPGAQETTGLHFKIKAYGLDTVRGVSDSAEAAYKEILRNRKIPSLRKVGFGKVLAGVTTIDEVMRVTT